MSEPEYGSLAALRAALRSNDSSEALDAGLDVRDAGLDVRSVTGPDPPVDELIEAGLIPEGSGPGRPIQERDEEIVALLKEIRDSLGGGS